MGPDSDQIPLLQWNAVYFSFKPHTIKGGTFIFVQTLVQTMHTRYSQQRLITHPATKAFSP